MKKSLRQALSLAFCASLAALGASPTLAAYPDRPVTVTVPTAPGGTVDIVARIVAEQVSKALGQPFVISNRAGAGGVVGTQFMARELPDGYSLMVTANSNQLIVPWVYKNVKFDPIKDFVPIAALGVVPNVLCVHPSFPAKDMKGFIAEVKANPGKYQYASAGSGTLNHLLGEMLNEQGGLKLQHVPYKGVAPAMTDVMGNQLPILFASLPSALEAVKGGKLRALGVSSSQRSPLLPDVPAIADQIPGFSGDLWVALYAPKGTSQEIVGKLYEAVKVTLASPEVKQRFEKLGVTVMHDGPAELDKRQQVEFQRWKQIVQVSGATAD
ncbi:Bug family tripartite tricarboxylate transporter substrate binding protein [Variovorax gossypii]